MARYFYAWIPLVVVFGTLILAAPWLALFALTFLLFAVVAALGALVWGLVAASRALGHAVSLRLRELSHASQPVTLNPGGAGRGEARTRPHLP